MRDFGGMNFLFFFEGDTNRMMQRTGLQEFAIKFLPSANPLEEE